MKHKSLYGKKISQNSICVNDITRTSQYKLVFFTGLASLVTRLPEGCSIQKHMVSM